MNNFVGAKLLNEDLRQSRCMWSDIKLSKDSGLIWLFVKWQEFLYTSYGMVNWYKHYGDQLSTVQ